jgi:signal transduction histidine kinase/CheY-like chemotaxis protein
VRSELFQLVQLLPEAAFLLEGNGTIVFVNAAAAGMLGRQRSSLVGVALHALVTTPPDKIDAYLRLCARSRQFVPGAFSGSDGVGEPVEFRCDGAVVTARTEAAEPLLFLRCRPKAEAVDRFALLNQKIAALSREVLERQKAQLHRDQLFSSERAARLDAERASRVKDEFLATLSHELRTPLSAILGWAGLLQRSGLGAEDMLRGIRTIERNARHQGEIIDDLLDMSRIISGKVRLDVQLVDMPLMIRSAVESLRPAAEAKNIRLQLTLDPVAGPIKGDPNRLQQVVWNLLSNALKFTPRDGRVQVLLERVASHVEVTVADNGEGIRPEFLPHVFDRFVQADPSITRRHGGLGLGLSIVKHLAELHGGSVRAHSPGPGQGSTFSVLLPLLLHPPAADEAHPASHHHPQTLSVLLHDAVDLSGVTVLVVDDEADARELMQRLLQQHRAVVLTAATGQEALDVLAATRPDLLVCDIGMPLMDGYEVMRRVRALPPEDGGRTPALAVTAFARHEDRTRAMLAGFNGHLGKPVEVAELVATIGSLAGRTG